MWWHEMTHRTVSKEVVIRGTSRSNFPKVNEIVLSPASPGSGYQFQLATETIRYDLYHLRAVQQRGARFNTLASQEDLTLENKGVLKGPQIKVVEHLVSALEYMGITDVHVNFNARQASSFFVPVVGPGIEAIVNQVSDHLHEVVTSGNGATHMGVIDSNHFTHPNYDTLEVGVAGSMLSKKIDCTQKTITYTMQDGNLRRSLTITPWEGSTTCVEAAHQPDVMALYESPIEIDHTVPLDSEDLRARPLARVATYPKKIALTALNALGLCRGITPENYFFANPGDHRMSIIERMFPKFRKGHNEHLVHTAVSDFPGERRALCASLGVADVQARITLANTNHLFRVAVLKQIFKDDIFIKRIKERN